MAFSLIQLVEHLNGQGMPGRIMGDSSITIKAANTLEDAGPNEISFVANWKYEKLLQTTRAGAVVVPEDCRIPEGLNVIRTADPYAAITALMVLLHGYRQPPRWGSDGECAGISPAAHIHTTARIGENANIGPNVTVGQDAVIGRNATIYPGCYLADRCIVGDDVTLFPNVVIYDGCVLGHRVTIHAGTVLGEDGLGYAPVDGKWVKIPQVGTVLVADEVEIGANCTIDRATLGQTVIGQGTKFSNLIAIGHGTKIGQDCLLVAQVGLAGSVKVGDHVQFAGQAGIVGHIRIGDNVTVGAKAGVTNDVPPDTTVLGQPAVPISECKRQVAMVQRLPELRRRIKGIENDIANLQAAVESTDDHSIPRDDKSSRKSDEQRKTKAPAPAG